MPLFMDTHHAIDGLTAEAVAGAHQADLATQTKYGVDYKQYWFNDQTGVVFCLVDAPDAETAPTSLPPECFSSDLFADVVNTAPGCQKGRGVLVMARHQGDLG